MCIYIYIYIHRERERGGERERDVSGFLPQGDDPEEGQGKLVNVCFYNYFIRDDVFCYSRLFVPPSQKYLSVTQPLLNGGVVFVCTRITLMNYIFIDDFYSSRALSSFEES